MCTGGGFCVTRYAIPPAAGVSFIGRKTGEIGKHCGRLLIPGPWRKVGEVYLLPDATETHLKALPAPLFLEVAQRVELNPQITDEEFHTFCRMYFSTAVRSSVDGMGRITIPAEFCRLLDLQGEVLLLGTLDAFEVWSPQRYAEYLTALRKEDE